MARMAMKILMPCSNQNSWNMLKHATKYGADFRDNGLNLRGLKASVNLSLTCGKRCFSTKKKYLLNPLTDYKIKRFFKPIFAHPRRCILSGLHNSVLHVDLSGLRAWSKATKQNIQNPPGGSQDTRRILGYPWAQPSYSPQLKK
jgi:hypothetical protein